MKEALDIKRLGDEKMAVDMKVHDVSNVGFGGVRVHGSSTDKILGNKIR